MVTTSEVVGGENEMTIGAAPTSYEGIGQLGTSPYSDDDRKRRKRFALLWSPTIAALKQKGWKDLHPGSIVQLYILDGPSERLSWALATPGQEELKLTLTFVLPVHLREVLARLQAVELPPHEGRIHVTVEKKRRVSGIEEVLEVRIEMRRLFAGCTTSEEMSARLAGFVVPLIAAAS